MYNIVDLTILKINARVYISYLVRILYLCMIVVENSSFT